MTVGGIAGKYPIHDIWSNEGGGRIHELSQRYGARMSMERTKEENARANTSAEAIFQNAEAKFIRQQEAFADKYGAELVGPLSAEGRESLLRNRPEGQVQELLADLSALESAGRHKTRAVEIRDFMRDWGERKLKILTDFAELSASSYDARFLADDKARLAAYNRMQATQTRMIEFGEMRARENAAREASKIAAMASLKEKLGPPSALYSVDGVGSIKIDFKALEKMGPGEESTAQLARLIGVLAERNGLGQLRDGLIGIVNGQNSRLAERAGG